MTEPATPYLVVRQLTLPPVRDPDRATDLLADYLHDEPRATDPGVAANLTTGQLDVHLTVYALNQEAAEARAEEILHEGVVHAVLAAAAEQARADPGYDEHTYWPIGYEALAAAETDEDRAYHEAMRRRRR